MITDAAGATVYHGCRWPGRLVDRRSAASRRLQVRRRVRVPPVLAGLDYCSPVASSESDAEATVKDLDRIANVAIVVAVAVFLTLVIRGEISRRTAAPARSPSALVGKTIRLPGLSFPAQRDSLVLGISTQCHYCNESLPFYKQLTDSLQGRLEVFAVLPQTQAEAGRYLADAGLSAAREVSADPGSIGVYATPTLLLVDSTGKVKDAWVGKQDEAGQRKILVAVLAEAAAGPRS